MPNQMPLATLQALTVHPFADAFPYVSEEETLELAQDIEANGLHHPIVLFENEILDGRNRLRALAKTNLTSVPVEEYLGDDPVGYIISLNLLRRQLSTGQKAVLALAAIPYYEERAKERMVAAHASPGEFTGAEGDSRDLVAEKFGIGGQAVTRAKAISLNAPDLLDDLKAGTRSVNDAYNELKRRQDNTPGATPGDRNSVADPHDRFDRLVDSKVSGLSELIAEHAPIMREDERRKVVQCLQNLIRQAEAA